MVRVPITVMRHHIQSKLGKKGFPLLILLHGSPTLKEVGQELKLGGTWRQELKQKPWEGTAYWLAPQVLLILLSSSSSFN